LPAVGATAAHAAIGVQAELFVPQLVVVQLLPAVAAMGEQDATPVGPELTGVQVVAV
jgi:hypothetical protein